MVTRDYSERSTSVGVLSFATNGGNVKDFVANRMDRNTRTFQAVLDAAIGDWSGNKFTQSLYHVEMEMGSMWVRLLSIR